MSRPRRDPLTARVVCVPCPDAEASARRAFDLLADALAEQAIAEARAEVAQRRGLDVAVLERREAARLDDEDRRALAALAGGGL